MAVEIDHYQLLGLPSGEEGSKLTQNEISKAYRLKALELHPDKRRGDPNAHANFQKLTSSYDILKDEKARKLFDDLLHVKRQRSQSQSQCNSKNMSDVVKKERKEEEERIAKVSKEEIERIRAMQANNGRYNVGTPRSNSEDKRGTGGSVSEGLDEEKVLKVTWDSTVEDYTSTRLKPLFEEFRES